MKKTKKLMAALLAGLMCFGSLPLYSYADTLAEFGTSSIHAPENMFTYPLSGDTYTVNGIDFTAADDGDVDYDVRFIMNYNAFEQYSGGGPFLLWLAFMGSASYAALLDQFKYEFVVILDPYTTPKIVSGDYAYTFTSPFLEVTNITTDSDGNFVVSCSPKMKFSANPRSLTHVTAVVDAMKEEIIFTATATFGAESNYNDAKASVGKITANGLIRVYPPWEAQAYNPNGRLMTALKNTFGEEAFKGTPPEQYLEINAEKGITTLLEPMVKIDPAGSYSAYEEHAVFWMVNPYDEKAQSTLGFSPSIDIGYTVYANADCTKKHDKDTDVTWTIEPAGDFSGFDFENILENMFPLSERISKWEAEKSGAVEENTVNLESVYSGIYKLTASVKGVNSDYCYVVVPGDVNADGAVSYEDASEVSDRIAEGKFSDFVIGSSTSNFMKFFAEILADLNKDHNITYEDVSEINDIVTYNI